MRLISALVCGLMAVSQACLAGPETSPRPHARDAIAAAPSIDADRTRPVARPAVVEAALTNKLAQRFRHESDPDHEADPTNSLPARHRSFASLSPQAISLSMRPVLRPKAMVQKAMAKQRQRANGAVCGDIAIQGDSVGFVPGKLSACGIKNAVKVSSVSGVSLSNRALMDCRTAKALKTWVDEGLKPAVANKGGGVHQIKVAAHYACRTRNNQPGAKISEHGKGRAIDITGFRLRDGTRLTLLRDWDRRGTGAILRKMHHRACGIFGTVLGPDSNRFHQDHFHFDTAGYRSGSFCR